MTPKISVVLTTYNSKERLRYALESYRYQTYPNFEVVIVDDGSQDGTKQWFERKTWDFEVKYIFNNPNKGRAGARNAGIEAAGGDVILFSDSDMIVERDFIERHANYHRKSKYAVVCGSFWQSVYSYLYQDFKPHTFRLVKSLVQDRPKLRKRYSSAKEKLQFKRYTRLLKEKEVSRMKNSPLLHFDTDISRYFAPYGNHPYFFIWVFFVVMNVSVRKKHLRKIGGFDEKFVGYGCEDTDVGYRLWKERLKFIVDPTLRNYHQEHVRNMSKQNDDLRRNIEYMVNKHQSPELALCHCVSIGKEQKKSDFLFQREQLLSDGIISKEFSCQLDKLIWRCAKVKFPGLNLLPPNAAPLDEGLFWTELNKVKRKKKYQLFAKYVNQLYSSVK
ncbi:glycosyltransferase family 2 protein [Ammoniphilus sp. CFH 90114]|uniref:glycosyltransferase family 2 protein n=1 Tax=Ammoniphilus sp. CFH 90114 TaxID=2493665 RepID=UPI00100DD162|nr:glycosyltransferase family 2 protein [Ammoniphilus sp. CFH 90114]RXT13986.1 glycosyltransferase [Ammoniphilus sp. CFH 90114]